MKTILFQFDTDSSPSTFDSVVAVDSGIDHVFSYGNLNPQNVTGLVHGAIFTRGPADLKHTAIFVGGSDVAAGEKLTQAVCRAFFGPMQVSVMMDSNGCNTTAAAAVVAAKANMNLSHCKAVVLGATGPVGQRVAELLATEGAQISVVSRSKQKAESVCSAIAQKVTNARVKPVEADNQQSIFEACQGNDLIIAAGAAGICFLPQDSLQQFSAKVAIDLNAVPPAGIADISPQAKQLTLGKTIVYGALGVGGTKMKVHKRAIHRLFESNTQQLETQQIYQIALNVSAASS